MSSKEDRKAAIAARFKVAREQAGLSQGQTARLLSYSRPTISSIEAGRRSLNAEELEDFSELFGVRLEWLARGEESLDPEREAKISLAARGLRDADDEEIESLLQLLRRLRVEAPK